MIHVCFGLHDKTGRYSKFTGTAMLSMFDNHTPPPSQPSITVHILHDNTLSADNRDKFSYIAGCYGQRVKFYNVEELCADRIAEFANSIPNARTSNVGIGAFYRLLISHILPEDIDKCIYLDSDIVVNLDIAELWQIKLGDKIFACITEFSNGVNTQDDLPLCYEGYVKNTDYFNSGVLLINLKRFRNEDALLKKGLKFRGEHLYYYCFDQDILNYCFSTQTVHLPTKFNFIIREARKRNETEIGRKIYHYLGTSNNVGLLLNDDDPYNRLWMDYFIRTPFFDGGTIGRLYAGFQRNYTQLSAGLKNSMIQVSAIMSGKTRAFFAAPADIAAVRKIFSVRPDEEIIPAENAESLKKLLDAMKNSRGQKIFFVMIPKFPFQMLMAAGFVPGRDFISGLDFLSKEDGEPLDTYALIKAM